MAKQSKEQKLMKKWWVRLVLALVFFLIAYGFASLAIDSGSWIAYALAIAFIVWGVIQVKHTVSLLLRK